MLPKVAFVSNLYTEKFSKTIDFSEDYFENRNNGSAFGHVVSGNHAAKCTC